MAVRLLRRLATRAPAPVFVARGAGAGLLPAELATDPAVRLVSSPRHATVLLAAGRFPTGMGEALDRVHDQLPHPRTVLWWRPGAGEPAGDAAPASLRHATVATADDVRATVVNAHRRVVSQTWPSAADVGADQPPHPFQGRGDHGQGGEGMMGGVPYGRPMAMTGDDRDGLSLDSLTARLGPFLVGWPPGLVAAVTWQGEVVQQVELEFLEPGAGPVLDPVLEVYARARRQAVPVAELERARARHHLRAVVEASRLAGLDALAVRAARLAAGVPGTEVEGVVRLRRALRRSGLLAAWSGVGRFPAGSPALTGPSARAAGTPVDARAEDPAYRRLDFAPVVQDGGDARARLVQGLAEAQQSLDLAARAESGEAIHDPGDPLEPPDGASPDPAPLLEALAAGLAGVDWADARITLCSLDLPLGAAPVTTGAPA